MNITPAELAKYVAIDAVRHINLVVDESSDVQSVADAVASLLPNPLHVGLGGRVSQGRNADVLPDEVFDFAAVPQTVLVEIYPGYSPSLLARYLQFVIDTELPNGITVIFLNTGRNARSGTWVLPFPISNKMVNLGIALETEVV